MKSVHFYLAFSIFTLFNIVSYSQTINKPDSTDNKPVQYRRGIELREGYQTYEEKYQGKILGEEQRRLFPLESTGVWTELNPKVPRVTYVGVYFVNKDTGWVVGDLGALIKTTDGGESWTISETNTTTPLLKVRSYNGQVVITSGYDGLILRSTDGGESFSEMASGLGAGYDLWGLELVNDTLGWACGATGLIKTTDAGESWQIVDTPGFTGNLWWIDFMNKDYGFIAADGNVLRTIDGGDNWEIIQAGDNQPLYCLDIIDSLHIAAAGYGGTSYRGKNIYSSDGGYTWINGGPLTFEAINCIKYVDTDTGYAILDEVGIWKTTNRGTSWASLTGNFGEWEFQLFNDENVGYNVGSGLKIYKADGNFDQWHRLFINDNFSDVFFVTEQRGFVISSAGNSDYRGLYKTTDGGNNWQSVPGAPDGVDLYFLDSLTGFLGASNSIYKTTDGGDNWYQTQGLTGGDKIFFINQTTGWAVHSNVIYKTTDRGEHWNMQFSEPYGVNFRSIFFHDSLNGWVIAMGYGGIYNSTDGGANWIRRTDIQIYDGSDIYFEDSTGFIVNFLNLQKTSDSGYNWFTQFTSQYIIRTFGWLSTSHGFIMGDGIYETTDSGDSWNEIIDLRNIGLRILQAPREYLAYSSGYQGLIYKYEDTTYVPVELNSFTGKYRKNIVLLTWITETETNNKGFEVQRSEIRSQPDETTWWKSDWDRIGFVEGNGTSSERHLYSYTNEDVHPGHYLYRLKQLDYNGSYEYSKEIEVNIATPNKFTLEQNYPNPFNPTTRISFSIPEASLVSLKVFDVLGREVETLTNKEMQAGYFDIEFNASEKSSGIYFYWLRAEGRDGETYNSIKKMVLIK